MKLIEPTIPHELQVIDSLQVKIESGFDVEGVQVEQQRLDSLEARAFTINESKIAHTQINSCKFYNTHITDVIVEKCDLTGMQFTGLSARRLKFEACRLSVVEMHESSFKDVTFKDCKFDLVNFRFGTFNSVAFVDCVLGEVDFSNSQIENLVFTRCELNNVDFTALKAKHLDLRSSTLNQINGLQSLKGAIISHAQLISLAPGLAASIGLQVESD